MAIIVPNNDQDCGWTTALPPRTPSPALSGDLTTDWVVVGAGYTGLSAARKLAELLPEQRITLVDDRSLEKALAPEIPATLSIPRSTMDICQTPDLPPINKNMRSTVGLLRSSRT